MALDASSCHPPQLQLVEHRWSHRGDEEEEEEEEEEMGLLVLLLLDPERLPWLDDGWGSEPREDGLRE